MTSAFENNLSSLPLSQETVDSLSPPSSNINNKIFQQALQNINSGLPEHWICNSFEKGFNIMLLSRQDLKAIQRQITEYPDGKVAFFVHCKLLPSNKICQFISCDSNESMELSSFDHVEKFSAWVLNIVRRIRLMEICTGVTNKEFESLWGMDSHGYIDKNPYQESRYLITYRSYECDKLVLPRKQKCASCSKLQDILRRRACIHAKGIKLHTSNMYLTDNEKLQKLKEQQVHLKRMKSKLVWLSKKVSSSAEAQGIVKEIHKFLYDIAISNVS